MNKENTTPEKNINIPEINKNLLNGTYIDIYGDDYETEIHAGKFFIHLYNELCHNYIVGENVNIEIFLKLLNNKYKLNDSDYILKFEQSKPGKINKRDTNGCQYLVILKDRVLMEIHSHKIVFWYGKNVDFAEIEEVFALIKKSRKKKKHNRKFYMIAASNHSEFGFYLQEFDVRRLKINIEENYNDDFVKTHNVIQSFLKKEKSNGLVLLHGKYGTGKTTYLRHIIANTNKRFIFLPLDLMEAISSPNFLPFISEYKDSILILEDCEDIISPRDTKSIMTNSLANLLNLGDGLLADALSIKIICTFNADLKRIDPAILRKGRLIARYEFKELDVTKAQAISDKIGIKDKVDKPMTLAEVYNREGADYSDIQSVRRVGF